MAILASCAGFLRDQWPRERRIALRKRKHFCYDRRATTRQTGGTPSLKKSRAALPKTHQETT
jgi:hypothetical protein